jgi:ABC-type glycerol-3-phosphate transport system substrate-binding protein
MFTACKKDDTDEKTSAPLVTEAPAEDVQAAGLTAAPTEITAVTPTATPEAQQELTLGIWFDNKDPDQIALQKDYSVKFSAEHPEFKIVPAEYSPYTVVQSAKSDSLPVVFENFYGNAQMMIEGGFAADITDILKERGWDNSMNPSVKEIISKDGRIYGIQGNGSALGLMVNTALFKEAGIVDADGLPVYPKTWAELAQTGKKIKEATGAAGFCLLAMDNAAAWQFTNIAMAYGATLNTQNADGTITSGLDSAEAIAAMEYVKSLKWEYDILTADPANENYVTEFTRLGTGAAAMCLGANDAVDQPTHTNGLPAKDLGLYYQWIAGFFGCLWIPARAHCGPCLPVFLFAERRIYLAQMGRIPTFARVPI